MGEARVWRLTDLQRRHGEYRSEPALSLLKLTNSEHDVRRSGVDVDATVRACHPLHEARRFSPDELFYAPGVASEACTGIEVFIGVHDEHGS